MIGGGHVVQAASAVITDGAGHVLLVKRGREPQKGRWSVPGGSVEPGESLREAAAREACEETGLQVSIGEELWCLTTSGTDGGTFEIHDFAATVTGGVLAAGDDADDVRWFNAEQLEDLPLTVDLISYLRSSGVLDAGEGWKRGPRTG